MATGAMWDTRGDIFGVSKFIPLVVLVGFFCEWTKSWPLDMVGLSEGEKVIIDKLREEVKVELTAEYMEEDAYLVKWLSAKDFNVSQAAKLLRDNLRWRRDHNIDRILEEDWKVMEKQFPYQRDTVDVEGRPLLYLNFGQWDINKLMTEEDSLVTLGRYLTKILEESDCHVRKLRRGVDGLGTASTPTQFSFIINFDGYNIWNQGCFQCLAFYRGFGETIETHFPRSIARVLLVNVPTPFQVMFWYIEANLAEKTRRSVHLYGNDRDMWEPALLSYVYKDQVPGGLLFRPLLTDGSDTVGQPSDDYITASHLLTDHIGGNFNNSVRGGKRALDGRVGIALILVLGSVLLVDCCKLSLQKLAPWQRDTIKQLQRELKDELASNNSLAYMKDDLYPARWLAAKNFHVDQALELFHKDLRWREEHGMERILEEDWSQMDSVFPYQLDAIDKQGRPLLYIKFGAWNIRKMATMMHLTELGRYFSKIMEEGDSKVRKARAKGKDVTQFTILLDLEGYSISKHGCLHCLSFYAGLGETLQSHFPRVAERVVFINAPQVFQVVFDTLQRMLHVDASQSIEVFGPDRSAWEPAILKYLERDQFPRDLTNTKDKKKKKAARSGNSNKSS